MKWIRRLLLVAAVLIVLTVLAVVLFLDPLVETSIETAGTYAMGVDTSLERLSLGITSGELEMEEFKVANPEGFETPHFMLLGDGEVALTVASLLEDTVNVQLIALHQVDMYLEKNGDRTNYQVILDNLSKLGGPADEKEPQDEPPPQEESGKGFIVEKLLITDISVRARFAGKTITIPIKRIELKGVGSETDHGVLLPELTGIVLQAILGAVVSNTGNLLPPEIASELQEGLAEIGDLGKYSDAVVEAAEGVTEHLDDAVKAVVGGGGDVQEAAGKAAEGLSEGLGNILGGEKKKE